MDILTGDNEGIITSFILLYKSLARRGLFVRVNEGLGEWDIIPMAGILARDYWDLILVNGGISHPRIQRERSRSPHPQFNIPQRSPPPSSPVHSISYSPVSSRSSSPLYIDESESESVDHYSRPASPALLPLPIPPPVLESPRSPSPPPPSPSPPSPPPQRRQSSHGRRNLCSVCKDPDEFTNTTFTRCGHMICEDCMWGMLDFGNPSKCPQCRRRGNHIMGRIQ